MTKTIEFPGLPLMERRPFGDVDPKGSCGTFLLGGTWRVWKEGDDTTEAPGVTHNRDVALEILAEYLATGTVTPRLDPDYVCDAVPERDNRPYTPVKKKS